MSTLKEELNTIKDRVLKLEIEKQLLKETIDHISEQLETIIRKEGELENDN
jgi:hypothetical protein